MKQQRRKPRWLHGKNRDEKSTGKRIIRVIGLNNLPIESNQGNYLQSFAQYHLHLEADAS
ncbi:MAG: hypothetical protein NTV01_21195 [Bacteroidia bacterium]|nr:hypothetical protein [Bacteroidia bacterium]